MTKQSNTMAYIVTKFGVGWWVITVDMVPKTPSLWGDDEGSEWTMS